MSGDAQLDLRTRFSLTPNLKVTPKALAALAHSGKSPVAGPLAPCEDLRIHSYSIIAHPDCEIGIAKSDFGLDLRDRWSDDYSAAKRVRCKKFAGPSFLGWSPRNSLP
jgi:hypothetical protein